MKKIRLILVALLLVGCSLSQEDAENIAQEFVQNNVRFFERDGNGTQNVDEYAYGSVQSYQEGSDWIVVMHVQTGEGEEQKDNDLTLRVRGDRVVAFNGRPVPQ